MKSTNFPAYGGVIWIMETTKRLQMLRLTLVGNVLTLTN